MSPEQPDDLQALSAKIAEAGRKRPAEVPYTPSPMGIAFRFATEMFAALVGGAAIGWGIDRASELWSPWHTRPLGIVVLTVLGAAAGVRNVLVAAREINASVAFKDGEK